MIEEEIFRSPRCLDQCACGAGVSPRTRYRKTGPHLYRHCGKVGWGTDTITRSAEKGGVMFRVFETQDYRTLLINRKGDAMP